ncbi:pentapeptide repeat-containing protein [Frankia sp. Cj5]|nr:pentapeptide repeat-containing protein [Frankia sp. Cj5]
MAPEVLRWPLSMAAWAAQACTLTGCTLTGCTLTGCDLTRP